MGSLYALQLHTGGRYNEKNMIHTGVPVDRRTAVLDQDMEWLSIGEVSS